MKQLTLIRTATFLLAAFILYIGTNKMIDYVFNSKESTSRNSPEITGLEGKAMPQFDILLPDSISHANTGDYKNKSSVLFYFSPFCPYCKAQLDEILKNMSSMKGIQFYALTPFPFDAMKTFYEDNKLSNYANMVVGVDYKKSFGSYFKTGGVPYIAIYGKDQRLNGTFIGYVGHKQIIKYAEK